jgi:predicted nucleic acid-binding protein
VIVVDASAVIAFLLREEGWEALVPYMKQTMSVDHVVKEFYNAVWKATYLTKTLDRESARSVIKLFNTYLKKNVVLVPEAKHIDEAFNIALEKGVPIYDALYIALAIGERAPLLTLDEEQRSTALELGIRVLP